MTHAGGHKQGFGPLEKITLIITGCIWTCPHPEGEGKTWERSRRVRSRGKEAENHIRWCIPLMLCHSGAEFPFGLHGDLRKAEGVKVTDATPVALKFNNATTSHTPRLPTITAGQRNCPKSRHKNYEATWITRESHRRRNKPPGDLTLELLADFHASPSAFLRPASVTWPLWSC